MTKTCTHNLIDDATRLPLIAAGSTQPVQHGAANPPFTLLALFGQYRRRILAAYALLNLGELADAGPTLLPGSGDQWPSSLNHSGSLVIRGAVLRTPHREPGAASL